MILYKTNDNWFGDMSHLFTSWTTTAYDRWWEARKQWGTLVNNCRNMAIYVDSMWPESDVGILCPAGIELMGEEIEDPFGLDCNDLPTGNIAHTIKRNVFELLEDRVPTEARTKELYTKVF